MNLNDFLRGFFNFPDRGMDRIIDPFQEVEDTPGEENENDDYQQNIFDREFGGFRSPFSEASEMFRHFEDMFRNVGLADFPLFSIEPHIAEDEKISPRDRMLKVPESSVSKERENSLFGGWLNLDRKPFESKVDTDLDDRIAEDGLNKILQDSNYRYNHEAIELPRKSFSHYMSVRTVKTADGKTEEYKTVKDSSGNVNTTVRRIIGDQVHSITTKSDNRGEVEKKEEFVNLDEKELGDFEKKWKEPRILSPMESNQSPSDFMIGKNDPSSASIFSKLFGFDPFRR